jgi:hypothetical protein
MQNPKRDVGGLRITVETNNVDALIACGYRILSVYGKSANGTSIVRVLTPNGLTLGELKTNVDITRSTLLDNREMKPYGTKCNWKI